MHKKTLLWSVSCFLLITTGSQNSITLQVFPELKAIIPSTKTFICHTSEQLMLASYAVIFLTLIK